MAGFGRLGHVLVFFATAGFAYPNVFVENLDLTELDALHQAKPKP